MKILFTFAFLLILGITGFAQNPADTFIGKPVPDLSFTTIDGKTYNLQELKGKTVVINLFFRQCGPCRLEMPFLNEVVAKYKGNEGIIFLAISSRDDAEQIRTLLKKQPFNFQIVPSNYPAKGKDWTFKTNHNLLKENFGTEFYPTNIIVDKNGIITFYKKGFSDTPEFKNTFLNAVEHTLRAN